MEKDLLSNFESGTREKWLDKITTDLKGKSIDSLLWHSEIGEINPVIFDSNKVSSDAFIRNKKNDWNIRQSFDANKTDVNNQILFALKEGVNAIEIKNLSSSNINQTLEGVMIDIVSIYMDINTNSPLETIKTFLEFCVSKNINTENINGGFMYDPIGHFIQNGRWFKDQQSDLSKIEEIVLAAKKFKHFTILNIDAVNYCNEGANVDTQIGYAIAHGNEYLNLFCENPNLLEKVINKLEFSIGIGTSYFLEIAKLRAFRSLWSTVSNQYTSSKKTAAKIHAINTDLHYSNKDMYNNLLRATTSGMSAVIGGCNSLTLLPFNINTVEDDKFGERISKNIQLVLQEEAHLNQVKDASKGSYYIESIVNQIKANSWNMFLNIEASDGFIEGLKNKSIQARMNKELQKKETDLKDESKIMVGVNKYVNKKEMDSSNNIETAKTAQKRLAALYE